jgi:small GTP-binding protein
MPEKEVFEAKIDQIEDELSKTKKNKATNKHIGILRAKIAKAKREIAQIKKGGGYGFFAKRSGDATVALVGFPSSGKSSLINELTNVTSKTGEYAFTTTTIVQGTMVFRDAHIQILDLPGILEYAHAGYGKGSSVIAQVRDSNLVLFVVDVKSTEQLEILINELRSTGIFINRRKPSIRYTNTQNSPFKVLTNRSGMDERLIKEIFNGLGIFNGEVVISDPVGEDEIIAILTERARYVSAIVALNKIDIDKRYVDLAGSVSKRLGIEVIPVSALNSYNIDRLKQAIYQNCGIMRVFVKPKEESKPSPITLQEGSSVESLAKRIHTRLADEVKSAYVSGPSAKFRNQRVSSKHILMDGDIITFIRDK